MSKNLAFLDRRSRFSAPLHEYKYSIFAYQTDFRKIIRACTNVTFLLFFSIFFQQFAHCRNDIHVFKGQHGQLSSQNLNFFMYRLVFIHDKQFLALNGAKTTSDLDPRNLEILFGNRYPHSLGQVY